VRIGEALATSWDDIDLGAGTARVEYTIVRLKGVAPTNEPDLASPEEFRARKGNLDLQNDLPARC
jgi:integrase